MTTVVNDSDIEPRVEDGETHELEELGGNPKPGGKADKRLRRNQSDEDVEELAADLAGEQPLLPQWRGVLTIEGSPTGDGREFAPDAITWADPPLPLRWQKEDSHGGPPSNVTVRVGNITRVWRDGVNIMGEGSFDLGGPLDDDPHEAYRRMGAETLSGVSIDADDITDADVEYIFGPSDGETEEDADEPDILQILFGTPEKILFHAARIRGATLCDIPAFVEAKLGLVDPGDTSVVAHAITHTTATSDAAWDGAANEKHLPDRMTDELARQAYAYVGEIDGDVFTKDDCRFMHHEVDESCIPGAANLTACSSGIGILAGGRGGTGIPLDQRRAVYAHLAQHLRDAGQEPPPYDVADALVAHAWHDEWRPPSEWFSDPGLNAPTPIIVTDQGRVYGLATEWGVCHLGFQNECILPPREDYHSYYMTGEIPCEDGSRVAVGQITAGITHAPLSYGASHAAEHYENTDAVVADVVVGNCKAGIWVAGAIRPTASAARVQALRASGQVSPDWRRIGGKMRLVGLLTVNVSGYQVPNVRTYVAGGELRSMVASGFVTVHQPSVSSDDLDKRALRILRDQLSRRVHPEES
jgi:hypothetical protein